METYLVGGAVRDILLGVPCKDVDYVVVGVTPEKMLAMNFKRVGADFPVFLDEEGNEFALARTERKTGRGYNGFTTDHSPDVTLEEDLMRRDLTINAMAIPFLSAAGTVIDPFGGREDLKNKVLRHVSEAFADDPVRVLRLARFHARYGSEWTVAADTLLFCKQMVDSGELAFLTRERVLKELMKALGEKEPMLFFKTLRDCGALKVVFPELDNRLRHLELAFTMFPSTQASLNYAKLTTALHNPEKFEQRLNVSVADRSYAKMYRQIMDAYTKLDTEHVVDLLYKMDAYRSPTLLMKLDYDFKDAGMDMHLMMDAFELTHKIKFDDLSEEQKNTLQGPEIAKAIKDLRKKVYDMK